MEQLNPKINLFCFKCKAPIPPYWTTGNKSLDSFIMESWNNTTEIYDAYIQWIEYTLLTCIQQMTSLCHSHGHKYIADWLDPRTNKLTKVMLKKIVDGQDVELFDFHQVNYFICKIMQIKSALHLLM